MSKEEDPTGWVAHCTGRAAWHQERADAHAEPMDHLHYLHTDAAIKHSHAAKLYRAGDPKAGKALVDATNASIATRNALEHVGKAADKEPWALYRQPFLVRSAKMGKGTEPEGAELEKDYGYGGQEETKELSSPTVPNLPSIVRPDPKDKHERKHPTGEVPKLVKARRRSRDDQEMYVPHAPGTPHGRATVHDDGGSSAGNLGELKLHPKSPWHGELRHPKTGELHGTYRWSRESGRGGEVQHALMTREAGGHTVYEGGSTEAAKPYPHGEHPGPPTTPPSKNPQKAAVDKSYHGLLTKDGHPRKGNDHPPKEKKKPASESRLALSAKTMRATQVLAERSRRATKKHGLIIGSSTGASKKDTRVMESKARRGMKSLEAAVNKSCIPEGAPSEKAAPLSVPGGSTKPEQVSTAGGGQLFLQKIPGDKKQNKPKIDLGTAPALSAQKAIDALMGLSKAVDRTFARDLRAARTLIDHHYEHAVGAHSVAAKTRKEYDGLVAGGAKPTAAHVHFIRQGMAHEYKPDFTANHPVFGDTYKKVHQAHDAAHAELSGTSGSVEKAMTAMSMPRVTRAKMMDFDAYRSATEVMTRGNSRFAKDIHTGPLTGEVIEDLKEDEDRRTRNMPVYKSCNGCGRTYMAKSSSAECPTCSIRKSQYCACGSHFTKSQGGVACPLCG